MRTNGQEETLKFKITGFIKFPTNEDVSHCSAITEDGNDIMVDPFVGCAYKYENREHLLNNWYEAEGHWFVDEKYEPEPIFLPREGKFNLLTIKND